MLKATKALLSHVSIRNFRNEVAEKIEIFSSKTLHEPTGLSIWYTILRSLGKTSGALFWIFRKITMSLYSHSFSSTEFSTKRF